MIRYKQQCVSNTKYPWCFPLRRTKKPN